MRNPFGLWLALLLVIPSAAFSEAKYVGSAQCAPCHRMMFELWKDTLHNKSQQVLTHSNETVVTDWSGTLKVKSGKVPEVTIRLEEMPRRNYRATLVDAKDPSKEVTYTVVRTYGGWGWKQQYQVRIGGYHYLLPFQWHQASSQWMSYNLQHWYSEDGSLKEPTRDNSFELNCAGCHNTGLEMKKVLDDYYPTYTELNTGCEKCHGPGSDHVDSPRASGKIVNPRKLPYERGLEVCGQCHSRGVSVPGGVTQYPWNDRDNKAYVLGEPLAAYFQSLPVRWQSSGAHSKAHHQQWSDLIRSGHFRGKVLCFDCHNPHGGPARHQMVRADHNNTLCLSCHFKQFQNVAAVRAHARHDYAPETRGLGRCSSCHMVKTASSAEAGDIHSHDFKVVKPAESLEAFMKDGANRLPNSCNGCHKKWGEDQSGYEAGVAAYRTLFGK
jgi:predicted CXXCH cytochrome family protein